MGLSPLSQRARRLMCFLISGVIYNHFRQGPWYYLLIYVTYWCVLSTLFTAFVGLTIVSDPNSTIDSQPGRHALHHFLYTLMMGLTPIVVTVYWTVICKKKIAEIEEQYKHDPEFRDLKIHHEYLVHSLPQFCGLLLMLLNKTKLIKSHYKMVFVISVIYVVVNYIGTKKTGKPLYWFLTWQDWHSPAIACGLIALACLIFYCLAAFDECLTEKIHGKFKSYKEI